jgi:hypothetical protein
MSVVKWLRIFQRRRKLNHPMRERVTELSMAQHGWKVWPATASAAEQTAALDAFLNGKPVTWFPSGYAKEPVITDGKLVVRSRKEEPQPKNELWMTDIEDPYEATLRDSRSCPECAGGKFCINHVGQFVDALMITKKRRGDIE